MAQLELPIQLREDLRPVLPPTLLMGRIAQYNKLTSDTRCGSL